jgi:hypothetical protein
MLALALAALVPTASSAAPLRDPAPAPRAEAMLGHGAWIGALVFLVAAAVLIASYSSSGSGPPASP